MSPKIKIFIVEDNFAYSYILEERLKEFANVQITSFTSGEDCIKLLNNNPNLIVLDYNLEGEMNGSDTFKMIQTLTPKTPVIILSSQSDVQIAADLLKMGVFDYIQKQEKEKTFLKLEKSILKAIGLK